MMESIPDPTLTLHDDLKPFTKEDFDLKEVVKMYRRFVRQSDYLHELETFCAPYKEFLADKDMRSSDLYKHFTALQPVYEKITAGRLAFDADMTCPLTGDKAKEEANRRGILDNTLKPFAKKVYLEMPNEVKNLKAE